MIPACIGLALALGTLGPGSPSDPADAMVERMSVKLADSFSALPDSGPAGERLLLAPLGLPLTQDQIRQPDGLLRLLDQIPRPGNLYVPSGRTCSGTYGAILRFAQVTRYQNQAMLNRLHDIQRMLKDRRRPGRPSQAYAAYLRCRAEYLRALDARATAQAEFQACGRPLPADLDARVEQALQSWMIAGFKAPIEEALAFQEQACDASVRTQFNERAQELAKASAEAGGTQRGFPVDAEPALQAWLSDAGWQNWSFRQGDPPGPRHRKPILPPGSKPPLPAVHSRWLETLEMTAQLKRITLSRPWLDFSIFRSRGWRLPPQAEFSRVSSGTLEDVDPGVMPLVITGLLLAKDLALKGAWEAPEGAAPIPSRAGPFALASPADNPRLPLHPYAASRGGSLALRVEGCQIIGFFCTPIPLSPHPDPTFFR